MADTYNYDSKGNYTGKSSDKPPDSKVGCCGLLPLAAGLIWAVWNQFSERPIPKDDSHGSAPTPTVEVRRAEPVSEPTQIQSPPLPPAEQSRSSHLYSISGIAPGDTLNVRTGPGANYVVADKLAANRKDIQIIGDSVMNGPTEWIHIMYDGKAGWVSKQFLKAN